VPSLNPTPVLQREGDDPMIRNKIEINTRSRITY
jgi:hypothetical protein